MKLLILTHDTVENLDRRIVNESRIFTDHGWKVHIVLTSEAEQARARELEKDIVVDPVPLRQIETVYDPLFHDPIYYESRVAELRNVVSRRFPQDSGMYRAIRSAFWAMRKAESWLPGSKPDPDRERALSDVMERQLTQTPRPKPRAMLNKWILCQTPPASKTSLYVRVFRGARHVYLAAKAVGTTLSRLTKRPASTDADAVSAGGAALATKAPVGDPRLCYPMPFTLSFVKKAKGLRADAILACDLPALPAALQLAVAWEVPLIYDSHELYTEQNCFTAKQKQVLEHHEGQALRHAQLCFVVSPQISSAMQEKYQLPRAPEVLYNAPMFKYETNRIDTVSVRRELGLPDHQKYLLYHGGMVEGRNLERLVQSFLAIETRDVVLVMLGYGTAYDNFVRVAAAAPSRMRVHPAVPQDDLVRWVRGAEACVIPYLTLEKAYEYALPNKFFDCIELSTPIIANERLVCIKEIVQKHPIGWVGPMESDAQMQRTLANGLQWLQNKDGRDAAFRMARERYGWEAHRATFCRSLHDIGLPGF